METVISLLDRSPIPVMFPAVSPLPETHESRHDHMTLSEQFTIKERVQQHSVAMSEMPTEGRLRTIVSSEDMLVGRYVFSANLDDLAALVPFARYGDLDALCRQFGDLAALVLFAWYACSRLEWMTFLEVPVWIGIGRYRFCQILPGWPKLLTCRYGECNRFGPADLFHFAGTLLIVVLSQSHAYCGGDLTYFGLCFRIDASMMRNSGRIRKEGGDVGLLAFSYSLSMRLAWI
ncbi:hypothetical protein Nepgr_018030 [Nepenthes gracilis]|uniref:Uncharacterized protein n=1 Tax=Nepenthes gracilis TaxID=150966 RepID=A0AAD3SST7_NEPGR|nr:hypothetical protein Nepgr_018030 [Nepenthes gracilis]